ncbi:MAG: hypothetical protein A2057_07490 [Ignavibacteria bacterium GWA2_35_9]|nr:MAG: hypothetical protein A2057_07490 [Ignavibacteria bacterium GWA2_35_9]OGU47479.1 MAG: hypothetical protein A2000_16445 [Ignavibacteria bacterium GWB2_36_8]OGU50013.1 MAG: hypothetical protein A2080_15765 [Ignavibacteria bacterium GWC2_36_12]
MELRKIAFLETYTLENDAGIMGAILVTDAETKPLEFRVTAPIKPTNFQKTLYGDVLLEHVLTELVSVPLLNAINEEIDLILVRDSLFMGANEKQGIRVVRVLNEDEGRQRTDKSVQELASSNGSPKLFVETSKKFEPELAEIKTKLSPIAEHRNLIEPFDRLKAACEQVHLQKTGE